MTESQIKIQKIRRILAENRLAGVRLRGVDWFSWATEGGCSVVILTAEMGVGEVLITPQSAWVLTNTIESERFRKEEVPSSYEIWAGAWFDTDAVENFVHEQTGTTAAMTSGRELKIASDRPQGLEVSLPAELTALKRTLMPSEIERYRALGRDAAQAMTEVMQAATPDWTETELAAQGARALWSRGIHPTLTLVGGESRVATFRHPTPKNIRLGSRAMMVFCARRHGLFANFTRWVYFRKPTAEEWRLNEAVARIEAVAFAESRPQASLGSVFQKLVTAYETEGFSGEHLKHHQGGTTGYLSRELVAKPGLETPLENSTALAWNPSLPGCKIEDTVLLTTDAQGSAKIEVLTVDPAWPTFDVEGIARPDLWVKS